MHFSNTVVQKLLLVQIWAPVVVQTRIWQISKILTFLVQFAILDFQLWLELNDDEFLGHCTDWDTLTAFFFLISFPPFFLLFLFFLFYKKSHEKWKKKLRGANITIHVCILFYTYVQSVHIKFTYLVYWLNNPMEYDLLSTHCCYGVLSCK